MPRRRRGGRRVAGDGAAATRRRLADATRRRAPRSERASVPPPRSALARESDRRRGSASRRPRRRTSSRRLSRRRRCSRRAERRLASSRAAVVVHGRVARGPRQRRRAHPPAHGRAPRWSPAPRPRGRRPSPERPRSSSNSSAISRARPGGQVPRHHLHAAAAPSRRAPRPEASIARSAAAAHLSPLAPSRRRRPLGRARFAVNARATPTKLPSSAAASVRAADGARGLVPPPRADSRPPPRSSHLPCCRPRAPSSTPSAARLRLRRARLRRSRAFGAGARLGEAPLVPPAPPAPPPPRPRRARSFLRRATPRPTAVWILRITRRRGRRRLGARRARPPARARPRRFRERARPFVLRVASA